MLPFPLLILIAFATLSTFTSALPTNRPEIRSNVAFEPLFRRATADVGPRRSLERLRLRRKAVSFNAAAAAVAKRAALSNPKAKRAVEVVVVGSPILNSKKGAVFTSSVINAKVYALKPPGNPKVVPRSLPAPVQNPKKRSLDAAKAKRSLDSVVQNPKAKRAVSTSSVVTNPKAKRSFTASAVVANPKAKRSLPQTPASPSTAPATPRKAPRNFLSFLSNIARSIKARRSAISLKEEAAAPSARIVQNPKAKRSLARRAEFSSAPIVGVAKFIPNPKSPKYSAVIASISSAASAASATSTSSTATTTTKAVPTTTTLALHPSTTSKTTSTSSAPSATSTSWPTGGMISAAYYPDWDGDLVPPSAVDFSLFDLIDFAFAVPTSDYNVEFTQDNSGDLLSELVKYAHGNNTKVLISVGGWTDSEYFSGAVSTSANRAKFVKNLVAMANTYGVDGIDIDWEYPGGGGNAGNGQSTSDSANFLKFLVSLRAALGNDKRISACVTQTAFLGADGSPLTDVSGFAAVLDNILVMNYDVWGASSTPGPNAPLSDACPNSNQPNANEKSSIAAWTAAGMPASKILMGVPSYGYISSSTATTLVHKRSVSDVSPGIAKRSTGISNRERASKLHAESKKSQLEAEKSQMHKSFEFGQVKAAKRHEATRVAEVAARALDRENTLTKRGTVIVCPNNHSGHPCAGIVDQNATTSDWNPLKGQTPTNSTTSDPGVFTPGVGVGKLGNGNLADIDGNQIQFYQLLSYGVMVQDSSNLETYTGTNGYTNMWDKCSNTPYLYDTDRAIVITYDDPKSMILKAQLAKASNLAGINMWDISGDTSSWTLVNAYRKGMGLTSSTTGSASI
ncbi:chitinase, partial [Phenoliferia sp. Uapishka_3]